jgi:hypothetical protein
VIVISPDGQKTLIKWASCPSCYIFPGTFLYLINCLLHITSPSCTTKDMNWSLFIKFPVQNASSDNDPYPVPWSVPKTSAGHVINWFLSFNKVFPQVDHVTSFYDVYITVGHPCLCCCEEKTGYWFWPLQSHFNGCLVKKFLWIHGTFLFYHKYCIVCFCLSGLAETDSK